MTKLRRHIRQTSPVRSANVEIARQRSEAALRTDRADKYGRQIDEAFDVVISCDGACAPNPGQMAVGAVIREVGATPRHIWRLLGSGTNQIAEIQAATIALDVIPAGRKVLVRTDSQYVMKTMMQGWRRNANAAHWEDLDAAVARHREVQFVYVRGHNGDPDNETADRLAARALRNRT